MVLAGRRGMCAHSGYFKICRCAPVGLVEEFCCGCHLDITSPVSASDLISQGCVLTVAILKYVDVHQLA